MAVRHSFRIPKKGEKKRARVKSPIEKKEGLTLYQNKKMEGPFPHIATKGEKEKKKKKKENHFSAITSGRIGYKASSFEGKRKERCVEGGGTSMVTRCLLFRKNNSYCRPSPKGGSLISPGSGREEKE